MNIRKIIAVILLILAVVSQVAFAQDTYIDLDARFSDIPTYEYNGTTYYFKSRVTTTLLLFAELPAEETAGADRLEMVLLLITDDDNDTAIPIQLDPNMKAGWLEGEDADKTLSELYSAAADAESGSVILLDAVNKLFPGEEVVEHYFLMDLNGLPLLDGIANNDTNLTGDPLIDRFKAIVKSVESGEGDANEMLSDLSGYIYTGMKSGELVRVVDKAERYDRSSRMPFPVIAPGDDAALTVEADLEAFEKMMIELYYEDTRPW